MQPATYPFIRFRLHALVLNLESGPLNLELKEQLSRG